MTATERPNRWDDAVLAAMLIVAGGARVGVGVYAGETFGGEATLAVIAALLGVALLIATWRRR